LGRGRSFWQKKRNKKIFNFQILNRGEASGKKRGIENFLNFQILKGKRQLLEKRNKKIFNFQILKLEEAKLLAKKRDKKILIFKYSNWKSF
jgi:hypothetical protein